jgi:two-component system OmpR family sensor kinase
MAKLFISLYVFITLALVGLSAGLETLFFVPESNFQSSALRQLLSASKQQDIDLITLLEQANIKFRLLNLNDIAWPPDSLHKLQAGEALSLYDPNLGEQVYVAHTDAQLIELSLDGPFANQGAFILYRTVFFVLLGGLIALWIWPLWRDLEALKKSVMTVLPDGNISQNWVAKSSLVAPIATSLNTMRMQIADLIHSQRELSGAVAHEFRTPLARLKFALGMLDDSQDEMLKNMGKDVEELEKLVQEMLDFSATEAQMPNLHFCEIPCTATCHSLVNKLHQSHLSHLKVNVRGGQELLTGDGHFVERAIENLLLNAARYAKTCIVISVASELDKILITVEDDGLGVDPALGDKIFEPFYRPDEGRDRIQGGAGLGLAIVKRVMQWHQGSCSVTRSTLGGAKFTLSFP